MQPERSMDTERMFSNLHVVPAIADKSDFDR